MLNIKGSSEVTDPELRRVLDAVEGYLYLGMASFALGELDGLPYEKGHHSSALRARVRSHLHLQQYDEAHRLSTIGAALYPFEPEFSVQKVFALHRMHRNNEADQILAAAPEWLRESGLLYYNLACYEARLGDLETARQCIRVAFNLNASFRKSAKRDPDLTGLWN